MINGAGDLRSCPLDLGLQQLDALVQLVDRQRVKVLAAKLGDKVVLAARQIFVGVHRDAALTLKGAMSITALGPRTGGSDEPMIVPETMRAIDPDAPGGNV